MHAKMHKKISTGEDMSSIWGTEFVADINKAKESLAVSIQTNKNHKLKSKLHKSLWNLKLRT